jgi:hypothetical protein
MQLRIRQDWFDTGRWHSLFSDVSQAPPLVGYFGTYNGSVAMAVYWTLTQMEGYVTVEIWNNGTFRSIWQAQEEGLITAEETQKILNLYYGQPWICPPMTTAPPTEPPEPEPEPAPDMLSIELERRIIQDYNDSWGWAEFGIYVERPVKAYLGTYNGYVIMELHDGIFDHGEWREEIAGMLFVNYVNSLPIYAWKDGVFQSFGSWLTWGNPDDPCYSDLVEMPNMYDLGLLTEQDVMQIHERFVKHREAIRFGNRSYSGLESSITTLSPELERRIIQDFNDLWWFGENYIENPIVAYLGTYSGYVILEYINTVFDTGGYSEEIAGIQFYNHKNSLPILAWKDGVLQSFGSWYRYNPDYPCYTVVIRTPSMYDLGLLTLQDVMQIHERFTNNNPLRMRNWS